MEHRTQHTLAALAKAHPSFNSATAITPCKNTTYTQTIFKQDAATASIRPRAITPWNTPAASMAKQVSSSVLQFGHGNNAVEHGVHRRGGQWSRQYNSFTWDVSRQQRQNTSFSDIPLAATDMSRFNSATAITPNTTMVCGPACSAPTSLSPGLQFGRGNNVIEHRARRPRGAIRLAPSPGHGNNAVEYQRPHITHHRQRGRPFNSATAITPWNTRIHCVSTDGCRHCLQFGHGNNARDTW